MSGRVPQWDLADRMKKALREADIGVSDMADYLDVARGTVSTWINGKITPNRQTQRLWALRCGVSYEWLTTGVPDAESAEPGGSPDFRCSPPWLDSTRAPAPRRRIPTHRADAA